MSIIHDALKKVQQTNSGSAPLTAKPAQEPAPSSPPGSATMNIPLLAIAACAVLAMMFAAFPRIASKKITTPAPAASAAPASAPIKPMPPPAAAAPSADDMAKEAAAPLLPAPTPPSPKPLASEPADPDDPFNSIQIEGVIDMGGKKAALINGNVYEEGQTIYGRTISSITFDTLTVIDNGRKRNLAIKP